MKLRLALLAAMSLTLAACDDATMIEMGLKQPPVPEPEPTPLHELRPPEVTPLQQPIEIAGAEQVAAPTADAETYPLTAFVAQGNEPFWRAEIAGKTVTYKTPDRPNGRKISTSRLAFAKGVEYVGMLGKSAFALTIRGTDCTDDMSGQRFPMTATLRIGNSTHTGCAAPASPAAAETAAAAAPKTGG